MSANIRSSGLDPVPESASANLSTWVTLIARRVNQLLRGKINARTTVTLTASATSTTLTDDRIGPNSHIALTPLSSSATAIDIAPWISVQGPSSATISHGSSTATDLNFSVLIVG